MEYTSSLGTPERFSEHLHIPNDIGKEWRHGIKLT